VTFDLATASPLDSATTYAVRVTTAVQDIAGNPLASTFDTVTGFAVRYGHTIVIDGVNDFAPSDELASSTAGGKLFVSFDDQNLYLGLEHPDIVIGGSGDKFSYFLLSTDGSVATGNNTSSDAKATFGVGAKLSHHWKERVDGPTHGEYRSANGTDWSTDWGSAGKTAFRANGFLEGSIALSELGNPQDVIVAAYTVDYTGDGGNGWVYNMFSGAVDGSAATPVDLTAYLKLQLPTSLPPNDGLHLQTF